METFYLLVCVAGLAEFQIPDICQTYTLQPAYEMTESEINSRVIQVCEHAKIVAIGHGGPVTKCEISTEPPTCLNVIEVF